MYMALLFIADPIKIHVETINEICSDTILINNLCRCFISDIALCLLRRKSCGTQQKNDTVDDPEKPE